MTDEEAMFDAVKTGRRGVCNKVCSEINGSRKRGGVNGK